MSYDEYPLHEGEYPLLQTGRRMEWGMALLCLICTPVIIWMVWNGSLLAILLGGVVSAALLLYGIRLLLTGRHDWAMVTNERIIVCGLRILTFRESIRECSLGEVKSYRLYGSAHSARKDTAQGELDILLQNGKHFAIPPLEEMKSFLQALWQGSDCFTSKEKLDS